MTLSDRATHPASPGSTVEVQCPRCKRVFRRTLALANQSSRFEQADAMSTSCRVLSYPTAWITTLSPHGTFRGPTAIARLRRCCVSDFRAGETQ